MKSFFPLIGLLGIFVLVGFLEAPTVINGNDTSNHFMFTDETESVGVSTQEPTIPTSTQLVLEETREDHGEIVEVYREYELYANENGVIQKRIPTSNYDYLRYKK